jgi:hypothetical protein
MEPPEAPEPDETPAAWPTAAAPDPASPAGSQAGWPPMPTPVAPPVSEEPGSWPPPAGPPPAVPTWPPPNTGDPRPAGWAQWVPDEAPISSVPIGDPPGPPPASFSIVTRGIDLNAGMSSEIRRASLYAGLMYFLTLAPIAALLIGVIVRAGSLQGIIDSIQLGGGGGLVRGLGFGQFGGLVVAIGTICFLLVSVDLQLVATAIIGGRAADRPVNLRSALGIARRSFWRLILGSLAVGLVLVVPRLAVSLALQHSPSEVSLLVTTVLDIFIAAPFVYLGAAIVLGGATPLVAVRASWRLVRRRWRLAFVIGIVNAAVSFITLFGLGAGLDVIGRIATALGVGTGTGLAQAAQLGVILTLLLVAGGSLVMTVQTLTTAPAVVAWFGLGGLATGLPDPEAQQPTRRRRPRMISLPMQVALVAETALALISVVGRG